jgi:hypothetical protein
LRWMERVGEQQEPIDQTWLRRSQHGRLPASIRMPAEEDAAGSQVNRRIDAIAARSPAWSRSALPRGGGPCGRCCRKGRSQRRTIHPEPQNASASVTSSGEAQFAPAPWVRMRQSPFELTGECRNPRTGTWFGGASRNSR